MTTVCPCCKQPIPPTRQKRTCYKCGQPIKRHDKWYFDLSHNSQPCHRHCSDPQSYTQPTKP